MVFGFQAVQDSFGRPKKAPKRHLQSSKGFEKVDPKMKTTLATFWTPFGALLEPILGPKSAAKGNHNWNHFWNLVAPALRGPNDAILRTKRECCKSYCDWNYIRQAKGGIASYKESLRGR